MAVAWMKGGGQDLQNCPTLLSGPSVCQDAGQEQASQPGVWACRFAVSPGLPLGGALRAQSQSFHGQSPLRQSPSLGLQETGAGAEPWPNTCLGTVPLGSWPAQQDRGSGLRELGWGTSALHGCAGASAQQLVVVLRQGSANEKPAAIGLQWQGQRSGSRVQWGHSRLCCLFPVASPFEDYQHSQGDESLSEGHVAGGPGGGGALWTKSALQSTIPPHKAPPPHQSIVARRLMTQCRAPAGGFPFVSRVAVAGTSVRVCRRAEAHRSAAQPTAGKHSFSECTWSAAVGTAGLGHPRGTSEAGTGTGPCSSNWNAPMAGTLQGGSSHKPSQSACSRERKCRLAFRGGGGGGGGGGGEGGSCGP